MSGYNAEISQPAENDDEELKPYSAYELRDALTLLEYDKARLLLTARHLVDESRKPIQADDYRLQHIWEQAGEIANDKGYCNVFDEFMSELGTGYERTREYCLTVQVTRTYDVHVTAGRDANMYDLNEALDGWSVEDIESNENTDSDWEITNWEYAD